jgi:feruloyl esterase
MHGSVVTAKTIVSAYYEKPVSYNYYAGCSTGGRQGLKEAEMYPEDFDGIIAGAPAWWTSHMQPWTVQMGFYNLPTSADYHIPPAKFPLIAKKVLEQCDPQDGLLDTVISDPVGCVFQPEQLHCPTNVTNSTSADCLTSAQISTLYKIYNGSWSEDEALTFPPLYLGAEAQWLLFSMAEPNPLGTDYVRYFLGLGPDWPYTDFNDDIKRLADSTDPGNATVGFDLSAFQAKGGKILSYHGLSDGLIPAGSSVYFYEHVYDLLRTQGIDVDEFFRFFLVPGMGHCQGTPTDVNAPWYFAGANQAPSLGQTAYGVPGFTDKEHDVMLALMAWVEEDTAPTEIIATKYVNDTKHDEVLRQRALCMYPAQAKYTGSGDPNSAGNWKCESPK